VTDEKAQRDKEERERIERLREAEAERARREKDRPGKATTDDDWEDLRKKEQRER